MNAIIGVVVIFGSVLGAFTLEGGNVNILIQPIEMLVIFGVASGAFLIANPTNIVKGAISSLIGIFTHKGLGKAEYLNLLLLLFSLFQKIRKEGVISIEKDVEDAESSKLFASYPTIMRDHHLMQFICDNFKVMISTKVDPFDMDDLMYKEIESKKEECTSIGHAVNSFAQSLPGLGIVAAVMGVVLTMGMLDQPPTVIGGKVAVALLGTFLGILGCYGFFEPFANNIEHRANEEVIPYIVVKTALVASLRDSVPLMACEFSRRVIPDEMKPTFQN